MGYKASHAKTKIVPDKVQVKWVGKAKSWARTEFKNGKQSVSFHPTKIAAITNEEKIT